MADETLSDLSQQLDSEGMIGFTHVCFHLDVASQQLMKTPTMASTTQIQ